MGKKISIGLLASDRYIIDFLVSLQELWGDGLASSGIGSIDLKDALPDT